MNNKKNKSKSRAKPTKTTQEENMDNIEIVKSESISANETRVAEMVTESSIFAGNDQLINDVPKKPKRSKGKKKKESLFEDTNTKEETDETKDVKDDENIENITQDNIPIAPCVRKKKKKLKKHDEISKENVECHNQFIKSADKDSDKETCNKLEKDECIPENMQIMPETIDVAHKDAVPSKKKKKKKHRHDSEKSDAHDPCISAFQKLIEPLRTSIEADNNNESIQQVKDEDKDVTEAKEVPLINPNEVSEEIKSAESTIKKKSKKDKKNVSEHTVENFGENSSEIMAEKSASKENLKSLENRENISIVKETSPKPKAKIVKPVQKKRLNKSESESVKTSIDHKLDIDTSEDVKVEIKKTEEICKKINTVENESNSDNILLKEISTVSSFTEILKSDTDNIQETEIGHCQSIKPDTFGESEDLNDLEKMSQIKADRETSAKNCDDLGFVEVKTGKGKKKRNKSVFTPDISKSTETGSLSSKKENESLNLDITKDKSEITSEDLETHKMTIPDLIEYPRSTSQQYIDSNTYIQEITSTDEVKLDIPFYTSAPIIQGSGESPEAKTMNDPVAINVTEINAEPGNSKDKIILQSEKNKISENTDIKSKMIEVNRDMEELRRSIERSLAELTAIEKSDTEVDKEFEELFQNQTVEQPSTNITNSNNKDDTSSIHFSTKKCDIEDVNSEKNDEISNSMEPKVTENVKTVNKDFDKNNVLSVEHLNVSLISDNKENKKSAADEQKVTPVCPARKDKGKNKTKKKGQRDNVTTSSNTNTTMTSGSQNTSTEKVSNQKSEKSEQKSETTQEKSKQQTLGGEIHTELSQTDNMSFEPIEDFEDALTSSTDDINKTFEMIAKDATQSLNQSKNQKNPQINIISPVEDSEGEEKEEKNEIKKKQNPISRPKNLLGHPNIPVSSNKTDFKKEKSKSPNSIQAKVKIKDSVEIEMATNKELLIDNKRNLIKESNEVDSTYRMKANEDLIYKYSFRKVFLQSTCHVCKKDLVHRVPCKFCTLVFYCSQKHKDDDWSQHQSLCFAVCTIAHLKKQKHIYADAQNVLGHNYRVLRMQTILSCEKILNRKLIPWEQEALLYPRICSDVKCRQWKQGQLKDCAGCGQISYCSDHPDHLPSSHQRWCKSYALYQRLVNYQLTTGRLEPPLPSKVLTHYHMPGKINDVLGSMYEDKIDMSDIQYAALTQIATAPLTAAYSYQLHSSTINSRCSNGVKKNSTFTIHTVGAELPFEADSLNKWEIFFLHLRSDVQDLRVVMVGPDINSSKLPLDLLGKIKLCENCQTNKRRVLFDFHDNESYHEYYLSDGFVTPDIVCAFNPNIYRSSAYNSEIWPSTINSILKQRVPFVLTSYSIEELRRDLGKVRDFASVDFNVVSEIKHNPYSSVRPDRNFITDHEIPLLFKNYCFCILCGTL